MYHKIPALNATKGVSSKASMDNARLAEALANIENLEGIIEDVREDRRAHALQMIRNDIRVLDEYRLFHGRGRLAVQTRALSLVHSIAFRGFTIGNISDVASWCLDRWLRLIHEHPRSVEVLRGMGEHWYLKAQAILRNVQTDSGSSGDSDDPEPLTAGLHSAEQVEARGTLIPAADFFRQAVDRAQATGSIDGPLLASAAEAHIALGTITSGRESLAYLQAAVRYLRMADVIDDYELSDDHMRYLEDYGQFVD